MNRIVTGVEALDILTEGGLLKGTITQIFGEKALGKSILSLQSAFSSVVEGGSSIIIDTEQSYSNYLLPYWKERLEKRFSKNLKVSLASIVRENIKKKGVSRSQVISALAGTLKHLGLGFSEVDVAEMSNIVLSSIVIEVEKPENSIIILEVPEITDLLSLHGFDCSITVSEAGRIELRLRRQPSAISPLQELVEKAGCYLIVYDSISAPLKSLFAGTADLPARSSSLAMILTTAQKLCSRYGLAVLATSHVSINPIQAWDRRPFGGIILGHEAKFSFELTRHTSKRNEDATCVNPEKEKKNSRIVWAQRHPAFDDYSRFGFFHIDEFGIH
jgi:RecA/RadA recombinase